MSYILFIEDDQWLAESYRHELESAGYTCEVVATARLAMERIEDQLPSAIVADIMLDEAPIMPLLHELASYSDTAQLPVILCTSLAGDVSMTEMASYGVVAILDKTTLTSQELLMSVQRAINDAGGGRFGSRMR